MSNEQDLEQIELSIEQAKSDIDKMHSMQKLTTNPDFIKIMLEGYFEKEASRLVLLKADSNMQTAENQLQITKSIDAIGYVRQYFNVIMQFGHMSQSAMENDQRTREELLAEG